MAVMWSVIFYTVAAVLAFYFILLRPVLKNQKDQRKAVRALQIGDEVVTVGGLIGEVRDIIQPADGPTDEPTHNPTDDLWDRHFLPWAGAARADAEALATRMMAEEHEAALRRFTAWRDQETDRWRLWARARATVLCGAYIPPTGDLFGAQDSGPAWRREEDPWTRLVALVILRIAWVRASCKKKPPSPVG